MGSLKVQKIGVPNYNLVATGESGGPGEVACRYTGKHTLVL